MSVLKGLDRHYHLYQSFQTRCNTSNNVYLHPVRTNQIPRQIPDQSLYTKPIPGIIMGGVLPFGCFQTRCNTSNNVYLYLQTVIILYLCKDQRDH
jgi:hypothetical protein